jgi:hypothetical protein
MRTLALIVLLCLPVAAQAPKAAGPQAGGRVTRGFTNPECAVWDAVGKCWYVSNLVSGASGGGSRAFLSRLDAEGKLLEKQWVGGFDAPKGMGISGRLLYISDLDKVCVVDLAKAQLVQRIPVQGARFLQDVAVGPAGEVYVSDMAANVIYRLRPGGRPEVFAASATLECPNGLWVDGDTLVVAAWGTITDANFGTKAPGRLVAVDLRTGKITPMPPARLGNLDGLVKVGTHWFVTDYKAGRIHKVAADGTAVLWRSGFKSAADLGLDKARGLLAIPDMVAGTVTFVTAD